MKFRSSSPPQEIKYSPVKKLVPKWQWYLLSLIILSPLIYLAVKFSAQFLFISAPGYVTFDTMNIRAPDDGYIEKVLVTTSNHVNKDQLLVKFISPATEKSIVSLKKELAILQSLKEKSHNKAMQSLYKLKASAEKNIAQSTVYFQDFKQLKARGIITVIDLQKAWDRLHAAEAELEEINRQISSTELQYSLSIEDQYSQKIRQVSAELNKLEYISSLFDIRSPTTATVIEVMTHADEYVTNGQKLLHLSTGQNFHIHAFLDPKFISHAKKGKEVTILFPNKLKVKGTITNSPKFAEQLPDVKNTLRQQTNKIVLIIKPNEKVPSQYLIYGVPVKVEL